MLAKFGRSHRGNCYRIYFEQSPSNSFLSLYLVCSLKIQKFPKGARKKRVYLKDFGHKSITYITYFSSPIARYQKWQMSLHELQCKIEEVKPAYQCFFCFSSSSLLGGLNWIWTDKGVIKVFFSFRLCSTVEEGGRSKILPPHLLSFQPRRTCSSEASFLRVFQEK